MHNIVLNTNTIPCPWKCATIIPIPKPKKNHKLAQTTNPYHFHHPLPKHFITIHNRKHSIISHHQGFKHKLLTQTALHNISYQITRGFNNPRPSQCNVAVALDISKAFDTVNKHKLIHKLTLTNIII